MNSQSQEQTLQAGTEAGSQTLDEVRRAQQRNLLSSASHPQHEQFAHVRVCLDRSEAARQFSPGERDNLAGALLLEATRERQRVDSVAFSQDGKRAFAVEQADSPARRICYVETEQAAQQSLQRSSEQLAQQARERDLREQQRQAERERETQRENERDRNNPERSDEQRQQPSAAARALTRERD